jgi:hypothetical protein
MAEMLGKSEREIVGLRRGEALECVYASRPEGCGKTVHCEICTIRNTLMEVLETGEPREQVPAYVDRGAQRVALTISAYERDGIALLAIDESR